MIAVIGAEKLSGETISHMAYEYCIDVFECDTRRGFQRNKFVMRELF